MTKPRFHRPLEGHHIGWEIYGWRRAWFVTVSIGSFELQLNRWRAS